MFALYVSVQMRTSKYCTSILSSRPCIIYCSDMHSLSLTLAGHSL